MPETIRSEMVMSYTRVRLALGLLGMMLPVVLLIGGLLQEPGIEPTISDFYHTLYRDIYVGTLCAIGVFLISYLGYRREPGEIIDDDWLATLAGIGAFGMALFPTPSRTGEVETLTQAVVGLGVTPVVHYIFAFIFFCSLSAFSFLKFARTAKPGRRRLYVLTGWMMLIAMILTSIGAFIKNFVGGPAAAFVIDHKLIFWFEAIGIWAFGLAWIVKSRADLQTVQTVTASNT
ncbi:hypothetical protein [Flavimaricola marinus]|uniref:DUF998 domain-containing protein n=1 Tax=Flavimaricola marinus TaxID=1819565 RepID=A0A238LGC8_9RHOB|nr:hypothetical protein [Flavimaricola marinus]SMY08016.1 hypothetical protein LOM8899_02163 [Flavimaricola marinus]